MKSRYHLMFDKELRQFQVWKQSTKTDWSDWSIPGLLLLAFDEFVTK